MLLKNNSSPFFSVIIPVYNKAPHISRSVYSVLNQDFDNFELLIINDASTDDSLSIINNFTDKRIRLFNRHVPGPGGYAARNLGIKNSYGKWIAFLDADDEWYNNHLLELYNLILLYKNIKIVTTSWKTIDPNIDSEFINSFCETHSYLEHKIITNYEYLVNSYKKCTPFWTGVISIKKSVLMKIRGFPEDKFKRGGDTDTWLRAIFYCKYSAWSSKITAIYYRDSINMVSNSYPSTGLCEKQTVKRLLYIENDKKIKLALKKFANLKILNGSTRAILNGFTLSKKTYFNLYFFVLEPKQIFLFLILFIFPNNLFKLSFKIYFKIKNLLFVK